jgi:hypothetical protein
MVRKFLWRKFRSRQSATAKVSSNGIDAGMIYTVYLKRKQKGRWLITEYLRYWHIDDPSPQPPKLITKGISLRPSSLDTGGFAVLLATKHATQSLYSKEFSKRNRTNRASPPH